MSTGIIVGRFQCSDLHEGHLHLIDTVISKSEKVVIFLGTSLVHGKRNPLNFEIRKQMLQSLYPDIQIIKLNDLGDNKEWVKVLDSKIKSISDDVVLYGSRDSFITIYSENGGIFKTELVQGLDHFSATSTRLEIANTIINTPDFRSGIIYSEYNNRYPTAFATVDVVVTRTVKDKVQILLGQKHNETKSDMWRFPGGFIDPTDETGKDAAARELQEETSLIVAPRCFKILDQVKIRDYRYRDSEHGIITTIYTVDVPAGWSDYVIQSEAKAGDDLAKVEWFDLDFLKENIDTIRPLHQICFKIFLENLQK